MTHGRDDTGSPGESTGARPQIAYALAPDQRHRFVEASCHPQLHDIAPCDPVWLPPPGAEALFTFASAWASAPADPPPGWPFDLRWIQLASAGVDALPAWAWNGVTVTCARGVTAEPIAEFVIAAIFDDAKRMAAIRPRDAKTAAHLIDERNWPSGTMRAVRGQTLGLVGFGAIGQTIARSARALGMEVLAVRRNAAAERNGPVGFLPSVKDLAARVDHLVLCAPSTPQTLRMIDAPVFAAMKPGTHLINVARGTLVDHVALAAALEDGTVGRASLDVTDPEPLPDGHPFYADERVFLTPHAAWYSPDHFDRLTLKVLANLHRFARGETLEDVADQLAGY